MSFNRNIVECKGRVTQAESTIKQVLIETLWNVKFSNKSLQASWRKVLIETLWNVKM